MSLHKLTAGDGYLYLVRQVAAADSTERGRSALVGLLLGQRRIARPLGRPGPGLAQPHR